MNERIVRKIVSQRNKILNDFTIAYLAETKLKPSEIVMCHHITSGISKVWFEKRKI